MISYEEYSKIRDSKGYKDGKVAELAGIGRSTFSDWKSGRSIPKEEKAKKIAAALNVSYSEFLGYEQLTIDYDEYSALSSQNNSDDFNLTDDERALILKYRNATTDVKDVIVRLLSYVVEQEEK